MTEHQGVCHCGRVRFSINAPHKLAAFDCNCRMCTKKGRFAHVIVDTGDFHLQCGMDRLSMYETGDHRHLFCKECGVNVLFTACDGSELAVNVHCIDLETLPTVTYIQGKHCNESSCHPAETPASASQAREEVKSFKTFVAKPAAQAAGQVQQGLFGLVKIFTEPAEVAQQISVGGSAATPEAAPHPTVLRTWLQMTAASNPHATSLVGTHSAHASPKVNPPQRAVVKPLRIKADENNSAVQNAICPTGLSPSSTSEQSRCLHSLRYHLRRHV